MTAGIYIVHPSEIFRKGLTAIIRNQFQIEIKEFSDVQSIKKEDVSENNYLIFFIAQSFFESEDLEKILSKIRSKYYLIEISNEKADIVNDSIVRKHISLNTGVDEILSILREALKEVDSEDPYQHEGEELSEREKEVLKLVALGYANKNIAAKLFISIHTVISHRKNITEKLGIKSISGLTVYAILNHLIDTSEINPEDLL